MPDIDLGNLLLSTATTNPSLTAIAPRFAALDACYFVTKVIRSFGEGGKCRGVGRKEIFWLLDESL